MRIGSSDGASPAAAFYWRRFESGACTSESNGSTPGFNRHCDASRGSVAWATLCSPWRITHLTQNLANRREEEGVAQ